MSRKTIRKIENFYSQEDVTGIRKDKDTGFFRLVSLPVVREQVSGEIKKSPEQVSDDLYQTCSIDDAETSFTYLDIDGVEKKLFFKKVDN